MTPPPPVSLLLKRLGAGLNPEEGSGQRSVSGPLLRGLGSGKHQTLKGFIRETADSRAFTLVGGGVWVHISV